MYYPKSQIKTNLYSQKEYQNVSTQELYQGPYYETSSGKKYTGKFPGDGVNTLLVKIYSDSPSKTPFNLQDFNQSSPDDLIIPNVTSLNYYDYSFDSFVRSVPQYYSPTPTPQENQQGYLTRYFCKKGNEYRYIEINQDTFNKLSTQDKTIAWDLYTPILLKWYITSNTSYPSTISLENQLGWIGFSRYVKPLKIPTTIQPK